jgi:hypothetical protein
MLIECANRGERIDLILFADTGGEKPHTYEFTRRFDVWLCANGMPSITWVRKGGRRETLEENCLRCHMLPSIAYGFNGCSHKYKIEPQSAFCNNWNQAKEEWKAGKKVVKLIGFDAGEDHRAKIQQDKKYIYRYPLVEWDMAREECVAAIENAGLCPPGKSACYFCPASKSSEIFWLAHNNPDLIEKALAMEANARLTTVKGLGRRFAWRDLLAQRGMLDEDYSHTPELACGCYDG